MHGSTASPLTGRSKIKATQALGLLAAMMVLAATLMAFSAARASAAEPLGFTFDEGRISLGDLKGLEIIDPDAGDAPATLSGTLDGNDFTAPAAGFVFPDKTLENIEATAGLYVNIVAHFSSGSEIKGTFDSGTGALAISQFPLNASFDVYVAPTSSGPNPLAVCSISGVPLALNTATDLVGDGETFHGSPFTPEGAAATTWESLPPVTPSAGVCALAAGLLGGPGGLWLAGESTDDPPPIIEAPTKAPVINTKPDASTTSTSAGFTFAKAGDESEPVTGFDCKIDAFNWSACNDGKKDYSDLKVGSHTFSVRATNQSGTGPEASYTWEVKADNPPPPGKPALGGLVIKPKTKAVKRGKKAVITVKVKNVGKATAAGVKVCVKAPAKLVTVKKCVKVGSLAAGKAKPAKFKVAVKKKAKKGKKAVLKFTATANGVKKKTGKATIKVK